MILDVVEDAQKKLWSKATRGHHGKGLDDEDKGYDGAKAL